jgi:predicted ATP-dependent serine protease
MAASAVDAGFDAAGRIVRQIQVVAGGQDNGVVPCTGKEAVYTAATSQGVIARRADQGLVFGEVGLGGEVRAVVAAQARVAEARQLGFRRVVLPKGNREGLGPAEGLDLVFVDTVVQALDALF